MLTWHLTPEPAHQALLCRGYLPGHSYAARSPFHAVMTAFLRPDGVSADGRGLLAMAPLKLADFAGLMMALSRAGVQLLHAERAGASVTYITATGQRA